MSSTLHKISESSIDGFAYFALYIDDENVVISYKSNKSLKVYNTTTKKLMKTHKCYSPPYGICHAYGMNKIYVAFGHFVVQYEIRNQRMEFIEIERIQVEDLVENIATTIDGFFTANNASASFRWRDFSIKSYIPYVKSGARPFICSSFCGKKVAYTTEHEVIVMDTRGKKLSGYSCSGIKPSGVSFDSDGNIIVCLSDSQPEQIKFDGTSRRSLKTGFVHPEGHKFISICSGSNFSSNRLSEFLIKI